MQVAAASNTEKTKLTKEMASDAATPGMTVATDPWPPVGQRDWVGFTNWVQSCKATDKKLRKTLDVWHQKREKHYKNMDNKLESWIPPAGDNDGLTRCGQPMRFYRGPPIGKVDLEKIGFSMDSYGKK